ncbi:PDLIM1, partial [Cervus elaphus hippelaphus]
MAVLEAERSTLEWPYRDPQVFTRASSLGFQESKAFSKVTPGSKAAIGNLCVGDVITAIDGENTSNMTHLEAQNKIKGCTDNMTLTVASSAPRIITNQYNNPAGLYSSENISSFNNALESKTAASGQETNGR